MLSKTIAEILNGDDPWRYSTFAGAVQLQLMTQFVQRGRSGVAAEQCSGGVPRDHLQRQEDQDKENKPSPMPAGDRDQCKH